MSVLSDIFSFSTFYYALALIFCICLVVFVHEMGHYCAARVFGVRIRKFSIGFGPEILGRFDRTGTRWSWSRWPLGGYVELFGYDSAAEPTLWDRQLKARRPYTEAEKAVAFCYKPLWQRVIIVAMGPLANFFFAIILMAILFGTYGEASTRPVINAVGETSPAKRAGLLPGDHILQLDGEPVDRFEDIWEKSFHNIEEMRWTLRRGDEIFDVLVTPDALEYIDKKGIERAHGRVGAVAFYGLSLEDIISINGENVKGKLNKAASLITSLFGQVVALEIEMTPGKTEVFMTRPRADMNSGLLDPDHEDYHRVVLVDNTDPYFLRHSPPEALWYAGAKIHGFLDETMRFLKVALFGKDAQEPVGGLITMGKITGKALDSGWYMFVMLIIVFSVQIGLINLLPIPVLDGGYLLFFAYEAIAGKPLPAKVQDYALSLGLIFLVGIMIIANIADIAKLWGLELLDSYFFLSCSSIPC